MYSLYVLIFRDNFDYYNQVESHRWKVRTNYVSERNLYNLPFSRGFQALMNSDNDLVLGHYKWSIHNEYFCETWPNLFAKYVIQPYATRFPQ